MIFFSILLQRCYRLSGKEGLILQGSVSRYQHSVTTLKGGELYWTYLWDFPPSFRRKVSFSPITCFFRSIIFSCLSPSWNLFFLRHLLFAISVMRSKPKLQPVWVSGLQKRQKTQNNYAGANMLVFLFSFLFPWW